MAGQIDTARERALLDDWIMGDPEPPDEDEYREDRWQSEDPDDEDEREKVAERMLYG